MNVCSDARRRRFSSFFFSPSSFSYFRGTFSRFYSRFDRVEFWGRDYDFKWSGGCIFFLLVRIQVWKGKKGVVRVSYGRGLLTREGLRFVISCLIICFPVFLFNDSDNYQIFEILQTLLVRFFNRKKEKN